MTRLWAVRVCRLQVIFLENLLGQRETGFQEASILTLKRTHTHTVLQSSFLLLLGPQWDSLRPPSVHGHRHPRILSFSLQTPSASQLPPPSF